MGTKAAINALKKLGVPVLDKDCHHEEFRISAELQGNGDRIWADHCMDSIREMVVKGEIRNAFGIDEEIHKVLRKNKLWAEWQNAAILLVYKL